MHQVLPPSITIPLLDVSQQLQVQPLLTYAAASLWNYSCAGDDLSDPESLSTLFSFTGTETESWFYRISVAMEAKGAAILPIMTAALAAVQAADHQAVTDALNKLRECIRDIRLLVMRMHERCHPATFYHHVRPFLAGSKGMEQAGLPRGVFYHEGDGKGSWRRLSGGSNGQSAMIQFFDLVLGVRHAINASNPGAQGFHEKMRDYMPDSHRRFLDHVAAMPAIRDMALTAANTDKQLRLREAYTGATDELGRFRDQHFRIVTRYIVLPSKHEPLGCKTRNLASLSSAQNNSEFLIGTGGTKLLVFLKGARDRTWQAARLDDSALTVSQENMLLSPYDRS